jgi:hypothetical protein
LTPLDSIELRNKGYNSEVIANVLKSGSLALVRPAYGIITSRRDGENETLSQIEELAITSPIK